MSVDGSEGGLPDVVGPAGWAGVEYAARVVFRREVYTDFGAGGSSPRVVERAVPVSEWALFGPTDYVAWLQQRWAPREMPHPKGGQGVLAGLIVLIGLVMSVAGFAQLANGSPALLFIGVLMVIAGVGTWMNWLRAGNPDMADLVAGTYSAAVGVHYYRRGHPGIAALSAVNVAAYGDQAHRRHLGEGERAAQDRDYWAGVASLPIEEQWAHVEAFRQALCVEYARRTHGAVTAETAPVPTYARVVAHLNTYPISW